MLQQNDFIQWFEKNVKPRWPKHRFDWVEMGDWHWRLREFDINTLTQAVRQHKACECYLTPNLKKVYEYAKKTRAANHPKHQRSDDSDQKRSGVPEAHTFIMCTGKDDRGRGIVGWFIPILLWPFNKTYTFEMYRTAAQQQCERHRNTYGGVWEIFTSTTHHKMLTRRMKLPKRSSLRHRPTA